MERMMKSNFFLIVICIAILSSCTTVKNALTGKKSENSDEFLVQKKKPLEMPPDYADLPQPVENVTVTTNKERIDEEIESLLSKIKNPKKKNNKTIKTTGSAEQFILKNIK